MHSRRSVRPRNEPPTTPKYIFRSLRSTLRCIVVTTQRKNANYSSQPRSRPTKHRTEAVASAHNAGVSFYDGQRYRIFKDSATDRISAPDLCSLVFPVSLHFDFRFCGMGSEPG